MKDKIPYEKILILSFFVFMGGIYIGWVAAPKQELKNVVETITVPKDMFVIKYSDIKWRQEPRIRCYIDNDEVRNGTIFLYIENSTEEVFRDEDTVYFAPTYIAAYPDIYPNEIIYLDKETGTEYKAKQYCRYSYGLLEYKKTLSQCGKIINEEVRTCDFGFGIYPQEYQLEPHYIEEEVKECLR